MTIFRLVLVLVFCTAGIFAGSECPPRSSIYPCACINVNLSKRKFMTIVICKGLPNTDSLNDILPALTTMEIDKFLIYDSFWTANRLGAAGESQKVLPNDWLTLTNIKELEIIDSTLSSCFACQWSLTCRNAVTTVFKVVNSTSSEKVCTVCDTGRGSRIPWMSCLSKLENFQLSHGNIKSITVDFFPLALIPLKILNLSYNQIVKIDTNTFRNVPNLKTLDLSHNAIEHIDHTFGQKTELEYVDLSHNSIKVIGGDLIPLLPKLISLDFAYNGIVDFKQSDWRRASSKLKSINLTGNPIRCDCNLRWVNSTFAVHVAIGGTCATPEEYNSSRIRPASRHMIERCDAAGNLGARKKKTSSRPRS